MCVICEEKVQESIKHGTAFLKELDGNCPKIGWLLLSKKRQTKSDKDSCRKYVEKAS